MSGRAAGSGAGDSPVPVPPCTARELLLLFLRKRQRVRVRGGSMWPTLKDGQTVLVHPGAYSTAPPLVGDIVLIMHPYDNILTIKRVARIDDGGLYVRGDCAEDSTDSRAYGLVPVQNLRGRVCALLDAQPAAQKAQA